MRASVAFAAATLTAAAQAFTVIDNFNSGDVNFSINAGTAASAQAGTMVGGSRLINLGTQSNPFGRQITATVVNGNLSFSSQALFDGFGSAAYGFTGDPNSPTFADLNLNLSADNAFEFDVLLNDQPADLTVSLRSASQNGGLFTDAVSIIPNGSGPYTVNFAAFGAFDFSDVDQIVFEIDGGTANDITLAEFRAVPEPATLGALAAGALLAAARKKRQK